MFQHHAGAARRGGRTIFSGWLRVLPMLAAALIVLPLLGARAAQADAVDEEVSRIQAEIDANGYCWTAGRTSVLEMPADEREQLRGLIIPEGETGLLTPEEITSRPEPGMFRSYFSWKDEGIMTPVKNQGGCGSCWAFAAVGVFEAYIKKVTDVTQDLSEQQMVSCTSDGCGGGWMATAYDLMRSYGSVDELCMPYRASDAIPCTQTQCDVVDRIQGYYNTGNSITQIKAALANGPVSCAMTAYSDFNGYSGGCYQHGGYDPINHAVVICGWDDAACGGAGAWQCKNSWGGGWGEEGYFWIRYSNCNIGYSSQQINYSPLYPVVIAHAPLRNTDDTQNGYTIRADVFAYLDAVSAARVFYRLNGGSYTPIVMTHTSGDSYEAVIPAQPLGTTIDYYIEGRDAGGRYGYHPKEGPPEHHTFRVMAFVTMDHCEAVGGWHLSATGDNATDGFWECGDPEATSYNGRPVQSEDDSTPDPGINCFVTGVAAEGNVTNNDVDGGKTTLVSQVFDLSDCTEAYLAFDLWYVNAVGYAPVDDAFRVDVSSNNGSSWHNIVNLSGSWFPGAWNRYEFVLQNEITLTSQVVVRFVANDTGYDNVVECGVDEFEISTPEALASSPNPAAAWKLQLAAPEPNPTAGAARLSFTLGASGPADLALYSLDGRRLRTLCNGVSSAGVHVIDWDGRDARGRQIEAGVYYLRLDAGNGQRAVRLTIVR